MENKTINREAHLEARKINNRLNLQPAGEIINLDYNPCKLYAILRHANSGVIDELFQSEMINVLKSYIILRKRVFEIARTPNSDTADHFLKIGRIFQKYHITDQIYGERHMPKAITIHRLMMLFPHLVAKIVSIDLSVESIISTVALIRNGLYDISPACFFKSSFCLLPKIAMDVENKDRHVKIIKAMLLAQYEQQEVIHKENERRNKKSPLERMNAVLANCKVIYNSSHIPDVIRKTSYNTFFLNYPRMNGLEFQYDIAGKIFDIKFAELIPEIEKTFRLMGAKIF